MARETEQRPAVEVEVAGGIAAAESAVGADSFADSFEVNSYLDARREWNERYGDYISRERMWRWVAIGALAASLVAVTGVVIIGSQNKLVPYVVEVNRLGDAVAVRRAEPTGKVESSVVKAQLARWLTGVRTVLGDSEAQHLLLREAYATVNKKGDAYAQLNAQFSAVSPFKRAETEQVSIEIRSILAISRQTWRMEWDETVRPRDGRPVITEAWQATVTIAVNPPTDEATLLKNPMGVYVSHYSWSKRL